MSLHKSTPDICILGAGFAGLTVALQLRRQLNWNTFTIYEKNDELGGAWLSNTFPGVQCDFPSHFYSWSFEPNPEWTQSFAAQDEILIYMKGVARKYNLCQHLKLKTQVESCTWDGDTKKWKVVITHLETGVREERTFDFVFSGLNFLWQPDKPKIFENFKRPTFHTAEWDHSINLDGKTVGVVGSGSSAVQVIPSILPQVKELHSFQRHTAWVMPKDLYEYNSVTKWAFRNIPLAMKLHRWFFFWKYDLISYALVHGSAINKMVTDYATNFIKDQTKKNPELGNQLVPDYGFGAKVVSFSNTYFSALSSNQVKVHVGEISEVRSGGIVTTEKDEETSLDVLILATGFKSQELFGPMSMIGLEGQNVLELWKKDRPRNYLGIFSTLAPNLFFVGGPYGLLGTSTVIYMCECQVAYILHILEMMYSENKKFVVVQKEAEDEFMNQLDIAFAKLTILNSSNCKSWVAYGKTPIIGPYSPFEYWRKTRSVDRSQFIIE